MYLWKCWRDTRFSFFGYLILILGLAALILISPGVDYRPGVHWRVQRDASLIPAFRQGALFSLAGFGFIVVALAGMALGSGAVGREKKRGGLEFLLTRPRSRTYFLWGSWGSGAMEMLAIILISTMFVFLLALWLTQGEAIWRLWLLVPGLFIGGMVFYGLSFCMTILFGDGQKGLSVAILVAVLYAVILTYASVPSSFLGGRGFSLSMRHALLGWAVDGSGFILNLEAGVWLLLALTFPVIAYWRFSRLDA